MCYQYMFRYKQLYASIIQGVWQGLHRKGKFTGNPTIILLTNL
jgi:hypothetical protein